MGMQLVAAISWTDAGPRSTPATVRGAPLTVDRGHLTAADLLYASHRESDRKRRRGDPAQGGRLPIGDCVLTA
jgi:hypothetical protein